MDTILQSKRGKGKLFRVRSAVSWQQPWSQASGSGTEHSRKGSGEEAPARPQLALSAQVLPHRAREEHVWPGGVRLLPHPPGVSRGAVAAAAGDQGLAVEVLPCRKGGPGPHAGPGGREKMRKKSRPPPPSNKPTHVLRGEGGHQLCALDIPLNYSNPQYPLLPTSAASHVWRVPTTASSVIFIQ